MITYILHRKKFYRFVVLKWRIGLRARLCHHCKTKLKTFQGYLVQFHELDCTYSGLCDCKYCFCDICAKSLMEGYEKIKAKWSSPNEEARRVNLQKYGNNSLPKIKQNNKANLASLGGQSLMVGLNLPTDNDPKTAKKGSR